MNKELPEDRRKATEMGKETVDVLIAQVEELLERGFYDKEECKEAERTLRTAQLLTQDLATKNKIGRLLTDIRNRYSK